MNETEHLQAEQTTNVRDDLTAKRRLELMLAIQKPSTKSNTKPADRTKEAATCHMTSTPANYF
jgi:hypothetical protein